MCVLVSRPKDFITFSLKKKLTCQDWKTHSEKIMEIVKDFFEKKLQQQQQTLEIVEYFPYEDNNLRNLRRFRFL